MSVKNVFICYRRDDAEGYAGRLYDRLNSRFPGRIFMDVTGISPGADFTRVIQERVGACSALIAVIGKEWLTMADEASHRRLFREDDYVRHEIATALRRNIAVFPVLVRDARMPSAESLPPDLAPLSFRNATEVRDTDFDHDVARLIEALELVFGERRTPLPPPPPPGSSRNTCLIVAVIALLLGGLGIFFLFVMGAFCQIRPGTLAFHLSHPSTRKLHLRLRLRLRRRIRHLPQSSLVQWEAGPFRLRTWERAGLIFTKTIAIKHPTNRGRGNTRPLSDY